MEDFLIKVFRIFGMRTYKIETLIFKLRKFRTSKLLELLKLCGAGLIAFLAVITWFVFFQHSSDQWFLQRLFSWRGVREAPTELVMVSISDDTYSKLGVSPRTHSYLPRSVFAEGLEKIATASPKIILLDFAAAREEGDPEGDKRIIEVMSRVPITIGKGLPSEKPGATPDDYVIETDERFQSAAITVSGLFFRFDNGKVWTLGSMYPELKPSEFVLYKHFPMLEALHIVGAVKPDYIPPVKGLINFYGPRGAIDTHKFEDILKLKDDELSKLFHDKVVVMGYQSNARNREGGKEEFSVPLDSGTLFGAEIHANIVGNFLDKSAITRLGFLDSFIVQFLVLLLVALSLFLLPLIKALVVSFVLWSIWAVSTLVLFFGFNFFLSGFIMLSVCTVVLGLFAAMIRYFENRRKLASMKEWFRDDRAKIA